MSSTPIRTGGAGASPVRSSRSDSLFSLLIRLGWLLLVDAAAITLLYQMLQDGIWQLAAVIGVVTVLINLVTLRTEMYPLRWIMPGLALMIVFVLYPLFSTVYIAFTNYGDAHLLTKPLAIRVIERETYLPEDAITYDWTAYVSPDGQYLLWLQDPDGSNQFVVRPGEEPEAVSGEPPETLDGYRRLDNIERLRHTGQLTSLEFGVPPNTFRVSDRQIGKAAQYEQRYVYDGEEDVIVDRQTGTVYRPVEGVFTSDSGDILRPGFQVTIGARNFVRLFTTPSLRGPFVLVFLWTVVFAALSVVLTFIAGLILAIAFDVPEMPARALLRSLLLIPYAIPAFISVPVWVGLLNPQFGVISRTMVELFGWAPSWFADPTWAKVGILLIQLWLGFPYMFVIVTGALQALPTDVYEAASIDGANPFQQFRSITLPLLLITVGPLLVASFAFNFNNFVVIYLYNQGGPPIGGTISPVGHTDILATYTFRIAFGSGRGADLGYAAAITVVIFLILVVITAIQFRFTAMLEERSENV